MPDVSGQCHCGAVQFEAKLDLADAMTCNCSLCSKKNAVMVRIPGEDFKLLAGEDQLGLYQWNTKVAKHHFCKTCGIYTHHQRRSNPNEYGVNLGALKGVNPRDLGEIGWVDGINHPSDQK